MFAELVAGGSGYQILVSGRRRCFFFCYFTLLSTMCAELVAPDARFFSPDATAAATEAVSGTFFLFSFLNSSARFLFQGAADLLPGQMPRYGDTCSDLLFVLAETTNIDMHTHVLIDRLMPRYVCIRLDFLD